MKHASLIKMHVQYNDSAKFNTLNCVCVGIGIGYHRKYKVYILVSISSKFSNKYDSCVEFCHVLIPLIA